MTPRRKLEIIVAVSTIMSFAAAAGAMYLATERYEAATRGEQVERDRTLVERYVNEFVWQRHAGDVQTLASDIANESGLRNAVATSNRDAVAQLLPLMGRRYAVTSGQIALLGVTVYDANGVVLSEHMRTPGQRTTGALSSLLAARQWNERYARLRHVWTLDGTPYLSVAVPIGGLKQINGYVAVHVDPLHALRDLDSDLAMHVRVTSLDGARALVELSKYRIPEDATKLSAEVVIREPEGTPVFRVEMQSDESTSARMMATIRAWSFVTLFAVLSLISILTGALVLLVSRRMAREEASAAKTALDARRIEERNADLQMHNEMLRQSEEALQVQNQRFAAALNNMAHGMSMFDSQQRLVVCNKLYLEMYRLPQELGRPGTPLKAILEARVAAGAAPTGNPDHVAEILQTVPQGESRYTVRELGDGRIVAVAYQPMAGGGWVVVHQDITAQKRAEIEIAHMAHHDALTNLPNRVLLRERLEQALVDVRRGGQLAVLYLDVDHFKSINDTLGHAIGDELLKAVAGRLHGCLRESDTIARLGGDEFAIIQTGFGQLSEVAGLASRIREVITPPYELDGHQVPADVSIGISIAPNDAIEPDQLLKNADMALYRSKSDGRGTFRFFAPEMDDRVKARRTLELDLRKAIANGEFELYYQPLVNLGNQKISCCEALLRWHHPHRGMVPPAEFIPVAEETGVINQIGEWVLRQACLEAATWPDDIAVAVNLSPLQFKNNSLAPSIIGALAASGLPARRLEVEITEAVLLQNNEATLATLHQLRSLGVRIAMDDFGTGYSSLSYLRSFPFDKIKIDRSFISDIAENDDSGAIVQAVTSLAGRMNMATTAEGVETQGQLDKVQMLGCTEMQGYLYSRPVPARDVVRLFPSRERKSFSAA
ncbi:MAG TPA: EAL domain-containing protein [Xanthobacteraceae bacterium]|nr:EAL domain-containing protein [Xanthobacteraceae bacterium]